MRFIFIILIIGSLVSCKSADIMDNRLPVDSKISSICIEKYPSLMSDLLDAIVLKTSKIGINSIIIDQNKPCDVHYTLKYNAEWSFRFSLPTPVYLKALDFDLYQDTNKISSMSYYYYNPSSLLFIDFTGTYGANDKVDTLLSRMFSNNKP